MTTRLIDEFDPYVMAYTVGLMISGVVFLLFGIRLIKAVTSLAGFIFFGLSTYFILEVATKEGEKLGDERAPIYIGVILGVACLGALLCLFVWKVGAVLLAFMAGVGISEFIMIVFPHIVGLINHVWARWILDGAIGLIFSLIILAAVAEKLFIVLCSSFAGSVAIVLASDFIGGFGLKEEFHKHLVSDNASTSYENFTTPFISALCSIGAGTILGAIFQYLVTGRDSKGYSRDQKERTKYRAFDGF